MVRLGLESDLVNSEMWDNLLLSNPKLEKLSVNLKNFYEGKRGSANLIIFDENLLLIWDNRSQQLYCLTMKDFKLVNVQNLIPTNAPLFDVDSIIMSLDERHIALQGPRGINVMELPRKFGSLNAYEGGQKSILCRTVCLAERFLVCNQQITITESRWHPGSPSGSSHIAVLTNDDCIRIYDISVPHVCFQEIRLSDPLNGDMKHSSKFASSLGQIAVSFDFGLPVDKRSLTNYNVQNDVSTPSGTSKQKTSNLSTIIEDDACIWPVYILRGNGDVILVYNDLHNTFISKRILGPLTMRPPAEDNYGVDACSIICLDCAPTLLAIATCAGMIYHCLALDTPYQSDSGTDDLDGHFPLNAPSYAYTDDYWNLNDPSTSRNRVRGNISCVDDCNSGVSQLFVNPPTLFVVESLELVLSLTSISTQDDTTPLRLIRPSINPQIYFCSHEAGIHIVNIPFLNKLKSSLFSSLDDNEQSIIEHLICTKPISTPSSVIPMCIPLGVALVARRGYYSVGVLLSSGEILTQRLSSVNYKYSDLASSTDLQISPDESISFAVYINQTLKRTMNAPHIKSEPNKEPSKADCLQMLLNTTDILRKEYLARMERASETLIRRATSLEANKNLQLEEISKISKVKEQMIDSIKQTSIKYDETLEKQEKLSQRVEKILETLQTRQNHLSEAERTCMKELKEISSTINSYRNRLDQVQLKYKYQNELKEKHATEGKANEINRKRQTTIIAHQKAGVKKILTSQYEAIEQLMNQVTGLHKHFAQMKSNT